MSEQEHTQLTPNGREDHQKQQRPANNDTYAWRKFWEAVGQPWRTEPEIDAQRQKFLVESRNDLTDGQRNIYPLSGVKLDRADIEWLLATHEKSGHGPVDLRGVDLSHAFLRLLPLGRADLRDAHLEGADLLWAHLENANLTNATWRVLILPQPIWKVLISIMRSLIAQRDFTMLFSRIKDWARRSSLMSIGVM